MSDPPEPQSVPRVGPAERLAVVVIAVAIFVLGVVVASGPEERLAFLLYDDAYYYYGVAQHLASGQGSTFDGIHATNGYHPLWCWVLVPVFLFVDDPGAALRIVAVVWFVLAAAAPVAVWAAVRPRTGPAGAVAAAALFGLQPYLALGLSRPNGLETPLYALLLAAALATFERVTGRESAPPSLAGVAAVGVAVGAAMLARLDAGFLAVAAAILMAVHLFRRHGAAVAAGRVAVLAAAATAVAGPSLAWNVVEFDHPVPVSGRMASMYARDECAELGGPTSPDCARRRAGYAVRGIPLAVARGALRGIGLDRAAGRTGTTGGLAALVLAAGLVALAVRRRTRRGPAGSDAVALLALFATLHYLVHGVWIWTSGETTYRLYYLVPEMMLLACAAGAALGPALEARITSRRGPRAALAVVLAMLVAHLVRETSERWGEYPAAAGPVAERHVYGWIRRHLPRDAILGARDAGKLGFFSGHPVVNLDGLINDQHLLRAIESDHVDAYICESPIRFLLFDRPWIGDFDPSRPERSPEGDFARMLHRLHARRGCSLREVPGATDDWVVLEVLRDGAG